MSGFQRTSELCSVLGRRLSRPAKPTKHKVLWKAHLSKNHSYFFYLWTVLWTWGATAMTGTLVKKRWLEREVTITPSKAVPGLPEAESSQGRYYTELSVLVTDQRPWQSRVAVWIMASQAADDEISLLIGAAFLAWAFADFKMAGDEDRKIFQEGQDQCGFWLPMDHIHGHLISRKTRYKCFRQEDNFSLTIWECLAE